MDKTAALSYVYAKLSGMLARSYVGARANKLLSVNSLQEVWAMLFVEEVPSVPESLLAQMIEKKAVADFIAEYIGIMRLFDRPQPVLLELLHSYDYANIKSVFSACAQNARRRPDLFDTGEFALFNYDGWPDFSAVTEGTPVASYGGAPRLSDCRAFDQMTDSLHITAVLDSVGSLPAGPREALWRFLTEEYTLRNILWALRLKVYYGFRPEEIRPLLVYYGGNGTKSDCIAGGALRILGLPTDSAQEWRGWKYARYLNPWEDGAVWNLDPRRFHQETKRHITRKALALFHTMPCTDCAVFAWFKIKQHELDCIRAACEGMRLNVEEGHVRETAGLEREVR